MLKAAEQDADEGIEILSRLFNFLILGVALLFIGVAVLVVVSVVLGGSSSAGVVIFIGPFPIVFGSGPNAVWLILIGVILAVVSIIFSLVIYRRWGRLNG